MKKLAFATNNRHKIEEVAQLVAGQFDIVSLNDINCHEDIEENGSTFQENAAIKTHFVLDNYHLDCFGDDSGLEIESLNQEPGVFSARYAGEHGNHEANIDKVLQNMAGKTNRKARFRTVISLIYENQEHFFEGTVNGTIREERSGAKGFGYDPIFQPDGYEVTFAEMSMEEKNAISHRAIATQAMINYLKSLKTI